MQVYKLMETYCILQSGANQQNPLGREDPFSSAPTSMGINSATRFLIDVGTALNALPRYLRKASDIYWDVWTNRELLRERAFSYENKARQALRKGNFKKYKYWMVESAKVEKVIDKLSNGLKQMSRDKHFQNAMDQLDKELTARDIHARNTMGNHCGISLYGGMG